MLPRATHALPSCWSATPVPRRRPIASTRCTAPEPASASTAPLVVLAIFFAQQVVSAALLNPDELWLIASGRASVLAAALAGAVLMRRDASGRVLPALVLLGGIVSVPVMVLEIVWPDLVLFPTQELQRELRAGGLFAQPNNVGTALTFAVAFLLAFRALAATIAPAAFLL